MTGLPVAASKTSTRTSCAPARAPATISVATVRKDRRCISKAIGVVRPTIGGLTKGRSIGQRRDVETAGAGGTRRNQRPAAPSGLFGELDESRFRDPMVRLRKISDR